MPTTFLGSVGNNDELHRRLFVVLDFARRHVTRNVEQFVRDSHRSAGLLAVDEEHQTVARVVKLDERRLIAIRQARRRGGVHSVYAPEELPCSCVNPIHLPPCSATLPFGMLASTQRDVSLSSATARVNPRQDDIERTSA